MKKPLTTILLLFLQFFLCMGYAQTSTYEQKLAEARQFYDKEMENIGPDGMVWFNCVSLKVEQNASKSEKQNALDIMKKVFKRIKDGESLEQASKQDYDIIYDEYSVTKKGIYSSEFFSDIAFSMEEGDMSNIFETPYGYHIIKVTKKKRKFKHYRKKTKNFKKRKRKHIIMNLL